MINEIMKPTGPPAELGLQRTQATNRTGGPDMTGRAGQAQRSSKSEAPPAMPALDREKAAKLADELTSMVQQVNRELQFKVDGDTGTMVIQVLDKASGDVLRQIPSEEIVALQQRLAELQESGSSADASGIGSMLFSSQA